MSAVTPNAEPLHVVVGVIIKDNQVCIARRHVGQHQGGLWEFPGGKVEPGESPLDALKRELQEEIDIDVLHACPLLKINFSYPDRHVLLDVWRVQNFTGTAKGKEGQDIKWTHINDLDYADFPAANSAIIRALNLPQQYVITGNFSDQNAYTRQLRNCLQHGQRLFQLRAKSVAAAEYRKLATAFVSLCHQHEAKVLLNSSIDNVTETHADGVHLNSQALMNCQTRPLSRDKLVAASVHNLDELQHAISLDMDFVVVAPVLETTSHPGVIPLGWNGLSKLASHSSTVIYALGGMSPELLPAANENGAYGVAGISRFWTSC